MAVCFYIILYNLKPEKTFFFFFLMFYIIWRRLYNKERIQIVKLKFIQSR